MIVVIEGNYVCTCILHDHGCMYAGSDTLFKQLCFGSLGTS